MFVQLNNIIDCNLDDESVGLIITNIIVKAPNIKHLDLKGSMFIFHEKIIKKFCFIKTKIWKEGFNLLFTLTIKFRSNLSYNISIAAAKIEV